MPDLSQIILLRKLIMQTYLKTKNYRSHYKRIKYDIYVRDTELLSEHLKRGEISQREFEYKQELLDQMNKDVR